MARIFYDGEKKQLADMGLKKILLALCLAMSVGAVAQQQLVIVKRDRVVKRYYPGDDFVFRRKNNDRVISSYVNNLSDTAVVIHLDTIPFHQIDRIYFRQHNFLQTLGTTLVIAGVGYFLVDQINHVVVEGNSPDMNKGVNSFAIPAVAIGLPLVLLRKKSQRMGYRYRLLTVRRGSLFYRDDAQPKGGYVSPYIPR